jgi:hypothetical protein
MTHMASMLTLLLGYNLEKKKVLPIALLAQQ